MAKLNHTPLAKPKPAVSDKKIKHEIWGVVFVFLGLFTFLSLVSYHHADPSLFSKTNETAKNFGGKIGANLSEVLIQFSGFSAFLISFLSFSFAIRLFQGNNFLQLTGKAFWILMAILSTATLLSLQFETISYGGAHFPAGGVFGGWIASSLKHYLNTIGTSLFTFSILLISLVQSTPFSAAKFFLFLSRVSLIGFGQAIRYSFIFTKKFLQTFSAVFVQAMKEIPAIQAKIAEKKIEKAFTAEKNQPAEIITQNTQAAASVNSADDILADFTDIPASDIASTDRSLKVIERKKEIKKPILKTTPAQSKKLPDHFNIPSLEFLAEPVAVENAIDRTKLQENSRTLEAKLTSFGIDGKVVAVRPGPVITMYEFKPGAGVKISQIQNLADDLSLALSAKSVRILAPIPGRDVVGIEIPNNDRESVYLREILSTDEFNSTKAIIPLAIGKDISGVPYVSDLAKMPHLLIAGAPGAGKSVFINSLLCSLLYKFTPNEMKLILVDPKQLELNLYDNIPHLLLPVVDDPKKASTALKWAVKEMDRRYKIMARTGTRHISMFNEKLEKDGIEKMTSLLCPQDEQGMPMPNSLSAHFQHDEKGKPKVESFPYILIIIDEFADLMMVAKNEVETNVLRIAQKARAAGIHLVIATQRPSVDVVTGLLKSNLPTRISFKVPSKADSRTILDGNGAEKLLGQGDMLFIPPGASQIVRMHGAFVTESEIEKICEHWKSQGAPVFQEDILNEEVEGSDEIPDGAGDEFYQEAISFIRESGHASASMLQRRFKVGYNRAARMIDAMESQGIVGPSEGAKAREVIY